MLRADSGTAYRGAYGKLMPSGLEVERCNSGTGAALQQDSPAASPQQNGSFLLESELSFKGCLCQDALTARACSADLHWLPLPACRQLHPQHQRRMLPTPNANCSMQAIWRPSILIFPTLANRRTCADLEKTCGILLKPTLLHVLAYISRFRCSLPSFWR